MAPGLAILADRNLKVWAQKFLKRLAVNHAVKVQAFALENDRFHLVLQWTPGEAQQWSDEEAVRRWLAVHPAKEIPGPGQAPAAGLDAPVARVPDPAQIRQKLGSLSMFMKHFKQMLTHKINKQFKHKGSVWRGRFHLAPLANASAVAGAMAFVDLRAVAEKNGDRPEAQPFTSIHARVGRYQAMLGMDAGSLPPTDEAAVFGPEVAQPLREAADPVPEAPQEPSPTMMMPPAMPPVDMPGMMPGTGGMGMDMGGTPMPDMPGSTAPSGGSWAGEPDPPAGPPVPAFNAPWLLALREDGPRAVLAWLTLPRYLKLLDALVEKAKAWPHLPATAPGRAQAPTTPPWESALSATLAALGLQAGAFEAQWARLATLRG